MATISNYVKEGLTIAFIVVPQIDLTASALVTLNTICLYGSCFLFSPIFGGNEKENSKSTTTSSEHGKGQDSEKKNVRSKPFTNAGLAKVQNNQPRGLCTFLGILGVTPESVILLILWAEHPETLWVLHAVHIGCIVVGGVLGLTMSGLVLGILFSLFDKIYHSKKGEQKQ